MKLDQLLKSHPLTNNAATTSPISSSLNLPFHHSSYQCSSPAPNTINPPTQPPTPNTKTSNTPPAKPSGTEPPPPLPHLRPKT
ncbi:hypothetical protein BU24DRAFT_426208 [Aaosphaeria arxii CBS 175.79]|uniref:Uncharacterized protein n=1 Tax=Aaosphaeria arxii CBS 175.79 TaxID=1450172 RepID=A0A6A5XGM6_9PLEO|nr:uncharacterized protein BU24DRAFT_426208 [Aaosphaeria arxii CBS 175.79]KAF2012338.1 hypothetical protein BU24DRAFT_426208 [Aaosphaeria arxii CBS 175.79]